MNKTGMWVGGIVLVLVVGGLAYASYQHSETSDVMTHDDMMASSSDSMMHDDMMASTSSSSDAMMHDSMASGSEMMTH